MPNKPKTKATRINWSRDPRLADAVWEWDEERPTGLNSKPISMRAFAASKGIPFSTFNDYAMSRKDKRKPLGTQTGPKPLLSERESEVLCQVAIRHDRANEGLTRAELHSKMQQLKPGITTKQAKNHGRTFTKKHKDRLKSRSVKAQKTTSKRS